MVTSSGSRIYLQLHLASEISKLSTSFPLIHTLYIQLEGSQAIMSTTDKKTVDDINAVQQTESYGEGFAEKLDDSRNREFYGSSITDSYRLKSELVSKSFEEIGMGRYGSSRSYTNSSWQTTNYKTDINGNFSSSQDLDGLQTTSGHRVSVQFSRPSSSSSATSLQSDFLPSLTMLVSSLVPLSGVSRQISSVVNLLSTPLSLSEVSLVQLLPAFPTSFLSVCSGPSLVLQLEETSQSIP